MKLPVRRPFYPRVLSSLGLTPRSIEIIEKVWPGAIDLEHVTEAELRNRGVTPAQARRLRAAMDLVVLYLEHARLDEMRYPTFTVGNWRPLAEWLRTLIGWPLQEYFLVLSLNVQLEVIGTNVVGIGDVRSVEVSPRMIFREAIKVMAVKVILVHNHPSGGTRPSEEDIIMTHRMVRIGQMLGIPVVDHIVLGRGHQACSLADMGYVPTDT